MYPLLGQEMVATRAAELRQRAEHDRLVKQAKSARRRAHRRAEDVERSFFPWRAVARGRAIGRAIRQAPTRPAAQGNC